MAATFSSSFDPAPTDVRRLNRAIAWSIAVHVGVVVVLLVTPRSWWTSEPESKTVMTINLGGTAGPSSTGQTSIGGRTVEQATPPPPRPELARPTQPAPIAPSSAPAVRTLPPPPAPRTTPTQRQPPAATTSRPQAEAPRVTGRAPVTGAEATRGNTTVDTGARGQGTGLTFGGGVGGGETDLTDFCCPDYLNTLRSMIDGRWNKNQPERGTTVLRFTIGRDGSISNITVFQRSGYGVLDRAAQAALQDVRLPPLPAAYTNDTLTIRLTFPYGTL